MTHDPFYQEILKALAGPLDARVFEKCVADLLRGDWPTLVPVVGGSDFGMDGAIADGKNEPFPLVTTTQHDVIGNLTKSLNSSIKSGSTARKVILATSRELTPRKRKNLQQRAAKLGFLLLQIYTREALADRLYRAPDWCHDLLHVTGRPSALSHIPPSTRLLLGNSLIGRDDQLVWLKESKGDLVLSGQPGSGKTFLLYLYAKANDGLFVVSKDTGEIANAIRSQRPRVLILDDAHSNLEELTRLRHLRMTIDADWSIIASSWPSQVDVVADKLEVARAKVRELPRLTRDEMVEIVKSTGIVGPNELIGEIVSQAEGLPGLGMTLSSLCIQGDVKEVVLGDALNRSVRTTFEPLLGTSATDILAGFAIGGNAGVSLEDVAHAIEKSPFDIRTAVTELAAGGIIHDVGRESLSVRPAALRHALVRDVFFGGPSSLDWKRFRPAIRNMEDAACTLVGVRRANGKVPDDLLEDILESAQSTKAWRAFAGLGPEESQGALRRHPEMVVSLARPCLFWSPRVALPLLLQKAIGDERALRSHTDHPLRLIEDWIKASEPGTGMGVERRRTLMTVLQKWLSSAGDGSVALRALSFVFSPRFHLSALDPGFGDKVTMRWGMLPQRELKAIFSFWHDALGLLRLHLEGRWRHIQEIVDAWAHPGRHALREIPKDTSSWMIRAAREMLDDVVTLANGHNGVLCWANSLAEHLDLEKQFELEPDFRILFPEEELENHEAALRRQAEDVRALASEWAIQPMGEVVKRIARFEQEFSATRHRCVNFLPLVSREIAQRVDSPVSWCEELMQAGCEPAVIQAFLARAALGREPGWEDLVAQILENEMLRFTAITVVISMRDPGAGVLDKTLRKLQGAHNIIESACHQGKVPESTLVLLLRHPDTHIAGAAAIATWQRDPAETIRPSIRKDWRNAVANYTIDEYWIGKVLQSDPSLAESWLAARINESSTDLFMHDDLVGNAVGVLDNASRRRLLNAIPADYTMKDLVASLVGNDTTLYQSLLRDTRLELFHLEPLHDHLGLSCVEMAKLALQAGCDLEDVAHATFPTGETFWGKQSAHAQDQIEAIDPLCSHADAQIREIGNITMKRATAGRDSALAYEGHEAVYGIERG